MGKALTIILAIASFGWGCGQDKPTQPEQRIFNLDHTNWFYVDENKRAQFYGIVYNQTGLDLEDIRPVVTYRDSSGQHRTRGSLYRYFNQRSGPYLETKTILAYEELNWAVRPEGRINGGLAEWDVLFERSEQKK